MRLEWVDRKEVDGKKTVLNGGSLRIESVKKLGKRLNGPGITAEVIYQLKKNGEAFVDLGEFVPGQEGVTRHFELKEVVKE